MSQEKVFMNVLYRKNAFPDYKKKCDLRRSQNLHFFQNGTSMVAIWQGKIAGYLQKTSLLDSRVRVKFSPWPSSSNFRLM